MPGPNRINVLGLICSCVSQAVLLGGILVGLLDFHHHLLGTRAASRPPLVVELIPLDEGLAGRSHPKLQRMPLKPLAGTPARATPMAASAPPERIAPMPARDGGAVVSPVDFAPSAAESGARTSDLSTYQHRLYEAISRGSRYPAEASRAHLAGVTTLAFTVDRAGGVIQSWIHKSSGSDLLDNAALEALERARPLPPIPASLPARIDFVIELDLSTLQQAAVQTLG